MSYVTLESARLSVTDCDAIVVGGSLAGVGAALVLAEAGRQVTLVEPRTYLGREVTATSRLWLSWPARVDSAAPLRVLKACLRDASTACNQAEIALHPDAVKRGLEDLLLASGVQLAYASMPVAILSGGPESAPGIAGLVIGNKGGRQAIRCELVVDTTGTALVARLAGASFAPESLDPVRYTRVLELTGVPAPHPGRVRAPAGFGLAGEWLTVHDGYRDPSHLLVEIEVALPAGAPDPLAVARREEEMRARAFAVAAYLLGQDAFRGARLAAIAHESSGPETTRLIDALPSWAAGLSTVTLGGIPWPDASLASLAGPVPGLWCINESVHATEQQRAQLDEPAASASLGATLARRLVAHWSACAVNGGGRPAGVATGAGRDPWHVVEPSRVPIALSTEVVVAGGGTSGALAAISAARAGARCCLVDMNPGLGGTGTYGGVHSYWFGRKVGFAARSMAWVDEAHDALRQQRMHGQVPGWNPEAKAHALARQAQEAGVALLTCAPVFAAITSGTTVRGVVAATRHGPRAVMGEVVVDATGDGDVAAFAGAETEYGSSRDGTPMWYSLAQFAAPGQTRNNFASTVDVSDPADYTRAILAGRRRGRIEDHDHGTYVAPRESRHVRGEITLTLTDQLLRRCWADVVAIAFSNNDIKGQASSDWLRMGLIPPNLEVEIPYRALLPRGLEGLLVVGKALSATHDALPSLRMQADLENLGGAAGLAAALAVRGQRSPREVDVRALQAALIEAGALPPQIAGRQLEAFAPSRREIEQLIATLPGERPLHAYSDMEIGEAYEGRIPLVDVCCAGPDALAALRDTLHASSGRRRLLLAQALALLGSPAGVQVLIDAIEDLLDRGELSMRAEVRHATQYAPDQAAMPDAAYLLHSLGMARDRRAVRVWQRVVDSLAGIEDEDVCDQTRGVFHYVDAVCLGAERLGDPAAIPLLRQLHGYAPLHGQRRVRGFEADHLHERRAYLELVIGRALARCGSAEGLVVLIDYLEDVRAVLRGHAHRELVAVSAQDHGRDTARWLDWVEAHAESVLPAPWLTTPEPVGTWDERVLVAASWRIAARSGRAPDPGH